MVGASKLKISHATNDNPNSNERPPKDLVIIKPSVPFLFINHTIRAGKPINIAAIRVTNRNMSFIYFLAERQGSPDSAHAQ